VATYEKPDALVWAHSISHRQAAEFEGCPCGCGDFCFAAAISPTLVLDWSEKDGESNGLQSGVRLPVTHEEIAQMIGSCRKTCRVSSRT